MEDIPLGKVVPFPEEYSPSLLVGVPFQVKHPTPSICISFEEFTSLCPVTGQPDFGAIDIQYTPFESICESKSLKLYLGSYRNFKAFQESITARIRDDFLKAIDPLTVSVSTTFNSRGGVRIRCTAEGERKCP